MATPLFKFLAKLSATLALLTILGPAYVFAAQMDTCNGANVPASQTCTDVNNTPSTANTNTPSTASPSVGCDTSTGFFGLMPWYHYLPDKDFGPVQPDPNDKNASTTDATLSKCDINSNFQLLPKTDDTTGKVTAPSAIPAILLAIIDDLLRIASMVAVSFVIYGAIRYMTSQGNPDGISKAQATVINALIGLGIAIVAISFVQYLGNQLGSG